MTEQQKPSVGRIVLYHTRIENAGTAMITTEPAIVTRVWSDVCLNLKVMPDGAAPFDASSVERTDIAPIPGLNPETPPRWSWPPRV